MQNLAVDVSGSVDQARFELQKQGYAGAFRNRQVLNAIRSGPSQAISVTMVQWTGPALQIQVVPWTRIGDEESATALADAIAAGPRRLFGGGTSISGAIDYAMTLWRTSPYQGTRRVIDVSATERTTEAVPPRSHATKRYAKASPSTACRSSRSSPTSTATTRTM